VSHRTQTLCLDLKSATRYATLYILNLIISSSSALLKSSLLTSSLHLFLLIRCCGYSPDGSMIAVGFGSVGGGGGKQAKQVRNHIMSRAQRIIHSLSLISSLPLSLFPSPLPFRFFPFMSRIWLVYLSLQKDDGAVRIFRIHRAPGGHVRTVNCTAFSCHVSVLLLIFPRSL
jgi:hypothetical protein